VKIEYGYAFTKQNRGEEEINNENERAIPHLSFEFT
jgi:hypothetical protein